MRGVGIVLAEARGQHAGVSSLLPPCVFMDQTSVARPSKRAPSPTEPSYRSLNIPVLYICILNKYKFQISLVLIVTS